MGTNTIASNTDGDVADAADVEQYKDALKGDIVPRNNSGIVQDIFGSIGSSVYRFLSAYVSRINLGATASGITIEEDSGDVIFKLASTEMFRIRASGVNKVESSGTGSIQSTTSSTLSDVSGLSLSITTKGRPVLLYLERAGAPTTGLSKLGARDSSGSSASSYFVILRDSTEITRQNLGGAATGATVFAIEAPGSSLRTIDYPSAGTYIYKVQFSNAGGSTQADISFSKLVALEL